MKNFCSLLIIAGSVFTTSQPATAQHTTGHATPPPSADHNKTTPAKQREKAPALKPANGPPKQIVNTGKAPDGSHAPASSAPAAPSAMTSAPAPLSKAVTANITRSASAANGNTAAPNGDESLQMLVEGNKRWVTNRCTAPNTELSRLSETATNGQTPFCSIITCSDSRIPVERVFDRGVGDLFVVRVAGNRAGGSEIGTIEYGVEHLKTPLLVVMGHSKCGAVAAAVTNAPLRGKVAELVAGIKPAVARAKRNHPEADEKELISLVVRENVWQTIFDLYKSSPELQSRVADGRLKVVGAVYDIGTGQVEFMGEHPWQTELVAALKAPGAPSGHGVKAIQPAPETHGKPEDIKLTGAPHADGGDGHDPK